MSDTALTPVATRAVRRQVPLVFRIPWRSIVVYTGAVLMFLWLVAPFYWVVNTSFMWEIEAFSKPPHWIPENPTLINWQKYLMPNKTPDPPQEMFETLGVRMATNRMQYGANAIQRFPRGFLNSTITALSVAVLNLVIGSLAAYSFARLRFRGRSFMLLFYIGTRMIPGIAIMIPVYLIIKSLGLVDNPLALIISYSSFTLPFTIWILKSYFQTIPRDLEDAARIDRCSWGKAMVKVMLPVATPGLVAAGMFAFMTAWGEFLFAVLFTSTMKSKTLAVVISELALWNEWRDYTLMATGGVIAVLLPLGLALLFQRAIVQGLLSGSVKG